MECKKCGFKNKSGSAYCTQCGEKLADVKFRNFVIIVGALYQFYSRTNHHNFP